MAMGKRTSEQAPLWVPTTDLPVSPGHPFYARLNTILDEGGFDRFDPDAKITKMKDGRTHLAHKAEHAIDLESGAMVAVTLQGPSTEKMVRFHSRLSASPRSSRPTAWLSSPLMK